MFVIETNVVTDKGVDYQIASAFEQPVSINVYKTCQKIAVCKSFRASNQVTTLSDRRCVNMLGTHIEFLPLTSIVLSRRR